MNKDYNVNVHPLLAEYNHTNEGVSPLISISDLDNIRGSGNYNPAPLYPQTRDLGHADSKIPVNKSLSQIYEPPSGELYVNPSGSVDVKGTWEKNTNYGLNPENGDNYKVYDEFQRWALNSTNVNDPYILPYLFSKINVSFIQKSTVDYIKKNRNITIETRQDTDNLLNLMLATYYLYMHSNGIYKINNSEYPCTFTSILSNLNKQIIEKYVQSSLSVLNMTEYYLKDISTLPMPFSRPVDTGIKGSNSLGFVGFFEDNHEFTRTIDSFNIRNSLPGKVGPGPFGN